MTHEGRSNGITKSLGVAESEKAQAGEPARAVPISSGPFEISPASFGPPSTTPSQVPYRDPALDRQPAGMPLSTIVAIGTGVFVVLVALTLVLLFR